HAELKQYFQDYARHFDLYRHYRFGTRVVSVTPEGVGWRVTAEKDGNQDSRYFDGVLIASGTLHTPNRPTLPGQFEGELLHACDYRDPVLFKDKRVLIVGCGNSACDMAVDAVHQAKRVDLSVRRGYYFLPKFIGGRPSDAIGGKLKLPRRLKQRLDAWLIRMIIGRPSDYGLPDPEYRLYEAHPVVNSPHRHVHGRGPGRIRPDSSGHRLQAGLSVHRQRAPQLAWRRAEPLSEPVPSTLRQPVHDGHDRGRRPGLGGAQRAGGAGGAVFEA